MLVSAAVLGVLESGSGSLTGRLRAGMARAAEAIDSGVGKRVVGRWVAVGNA